MCADIEARAAGAKLSDSTNRAAAASQEPSTRTTTFAQPGCGSVTMAVTQVGSSSEPSTVPASMVASARPSTPEGMDASPVARPTTTAKDSRTPGGSLQAAATLPPASAPQKSSSRSVSISPNTLCSASPVNSAAA